MPGIKEAPDDAWADIAAGMPHHAGKQDPGMTSAGLIEESGTIGSTTSPSGTACSALEPEGPHLPKTLCLPACSTA